MPVKRSRPGRSSSFGDAGFLSQVPKPAVVASPEQRLEKRGATPTNSAKIMKPAEVAGEQQGGLKILTVASPEADKGKVDASSEELIGGFLEKCYFCNRQINENVEVFMYG